MEKAKEARRFVEKLDFMTTPGYLTGPGAREAAGLSPGTGPFRVITDLAIMGYHEETKRMEVLSLHPGVSVEQVQANTGFAITGREPLLTTAPPSDQELCILREEVDPLRYVIGRSYITVRDSAATCGGAKGVKSTPNVYFTPLAPPQVAAESRTVI